MISDEFIHRWRFLLGILNLNFQFQHWIDANLKKNRGTTPRSYLWIGMVWYGIDRWIEKSKIHVFEIFYFESHKMNVWTNFGGVNIRCNHLAVKPHLVSAQDTSKNSGNKILEIVKDIIPKNWISNQINRYLLQSQRTHRNILVFQHLTTVNFVKLIECGEDF